MILSRARWIRMGWIVALVLLGVSLSMAVRRRGGDTDAERVFRRADAAFKAGRYAEAEAAQLRLARIRPPISIDRFLRAEVNVALERPEAALPSSRRYPTMIPWRRRADSGPVRSRSAAG